MARAHLLDAMVFQEALGGDVEGVGQVRLTVVGFAADVDEDGIFAVDHDDGLGRRDAAVVGGTAHRLDDPPQAACHGEQGPVPVLHEKFLQHCLLSRRDGTAHVRRLR